jgi:metal-responsive CopG/Arc/MetJ family transcriptional regulator
MEKMTERVAVLLTPEQLQQIDDYRFANRIGSRGEAIRQLLAIALATEHNKSANA